MAVSPRLPSLDTSSKRWLGSPATSLLLRASSSLMSLMVLLLLEPFLSSAGCKSGASLDSLSNQSSSKMTIRLLETMDMVLPSSRTSTSTSSPSWMSCEPRSCKMVVLACLPSWNSSLTMSPSLLEKVSSLFITSKRTTLRWRCHHTC